MTKVPCAKNCPDRWANQETNCRAICPRWKAYWEEKQKEYENKKACLHVGEHCDAYYKRIQKLKSRGAYYKTSK